MESVQVFVDIYVCSIIVAAIFCLSTAVGIVIFEKSNSYFKYIEKQFSQFNKKKGQYLFEKTGIV